MYNETKAKAYTDEIMELVNETVPVIRKTMSDTLQKALGIHDKHCVQTGAAAEACADEFLMHFTNFLFQHVESEGAKEREND